MTAKVCMEQQSIHFFKEILIFYKPNNTRVIYIYINNTFILYIEYTLYTIYNV